MTRIGEFMMDLPQYVIQTIDRLETSGCPTFLVGGCVRDILLGKTPHDYDLATSADTGQIKACFDRVLTIGEKHGTFGIMTGDKLIEVSTFRGNQDKEWIDLEQALKTDLSERDFTINAMAMDRDGRVYDPWDGRQDLAAGTIRSTADRGDHLFSRDPLRMLRAIRLSAVYGFAIEATTWQQIVQLHSLLDRAAAERVRDELNRILVSERPAQGIRLLYKSGLLHYIIPELEIAAGFDQRSPHHDRDVLEHSLSALENTAPRLSLRLAALLHDIAKPACFSQDGTGKGHFYGHHLLGSEMVLTIMARLKYDYYTMETVALLVAAHMSRFEKIREKPLKKLIVQVGQHNLDDLFELQRADIIASAPPCDFSFLDQMERDVQRILEENPPMQRNDLAVNGDDLIALGYEAGPELGRTLMDLLEIVLEDPARNDKAILLKMARSKLESLAGE